MTKKAEILSPCGGAESVEAALRCGADAIYLGARNFSARRNAVNFSDDELKAAVRECHRRGVLVYSALNTLLRDEELPAAAELIKLFCEAGVDGIIIQDMAVYETAKAACPEMPLHASTQMTIHTAFGVIEAKRLGFKRAVLARELSLKKIGELCGLGIEIEVFVHGALCMSVSGQCRLSAMIGTRSANRGLCAGACRLPFSAKGLPKGDYALSLKDMSYCEHIRALIDAGVDSLKIEGRMKRPEYVAAATNAVKCSVDGLDFDREALRAAFSRSGFTDGYLTEKLGRDMFGARRKEDVEAAAEALPKLRKLYEEDEKRFSADIKFKASLGGPISVYITDGDISAEVFGDPPERAQTRETTAEEIAERLKKLGGTIYEAGKVEVETESGLYISAAKINAVRRSAIEALDEKRIEKLSKPKNFDESVLNFNFPMLLIRKYPEFRVRVEDISQLSLLELNGETVIIPLGKEKEYLEAGYSPENCVISPPCFTVDEKKALESLKFAKTLGFKAVECSEIGQIAAAKEAGLAPVGGIGLNITNSLAARHYFSQGVETMLLSPELRASQASRIASPGRLGAVLYGRLPLMTMRNCPISAQVGCKNCRKKLTDRTGAEFPIICRKEAGVFELLNSKKIWLADKLGGINLDFGDLYFTDETPEEAAEVLKSYREAEKAGALPFTRGLYFRGVE